MSAGLKERQAGPVTVLEVSGRLAMGPSCDEVDQRLQDLLATGHKALLVDCSAVSTIDSQGIKSLVRGFISAKTRGGKLKLLKPSPRVREVLTITHLLSVMEAYDDEETALKSFNP